MAIDFPAAPANGAIHSAAGAVVDPDGTKWKAGTGLTGGGTSGDLTLALATPVSVAMTSPTISGASGS